MDENAYQRIVPRWHGVVDPETVRQIIEAYLAQEPKPEEYIDTDPVYRMVDDLTATMQKRGRQEYVICRDLRAAVLRLVTERNANVALIERAKMERATIKQQIYDAETAYVERLKTVLKDYIETGTAGTKVMAMKLVSELRQWRSPPP